MAASGKPTHGVQLAALLAAVMTVALLTGASTASLDDDLFMHPPPPQPLVSIVTLNVSNLLTQQIYYTVVTELVLGTVVSSTSELIEPQSSKEVKVDPLGEPGVGFTVTIRVGQDIYDDKGTSALINLETRTVAQAGILQRSVSWPCPDGKPGLYIVDNNPTGVGNKDTCTGPPRPKSR